jgi:hypothetical protein
MITKKFNLDCMAYDENLSFAFDDDNTLFISHSIRTFYAFQRPFLFTLYRKFKMIWAAITGKEYAFYEIVIDAEQLQDFKKFVAFL